MNTYEIYFVQEHLLHTRRASSPRAALGKAMRELDDLAMRPQRGGLFELRRNQKLTIEITRTA